MAQEKREQQYQVSLRLTDTQLQMLFNSHYEATEDGMFMAEDPNSAQEVEDAKFYKEQMEELTHELLSVMESHEVDTDFCPFHTRLWHLK